MKTRITKILFISLLFSAKIFSAAAIEEERPLTDAIRDNKSLEEIGSLVENNASVDEKSRNGHSALMIAAVENKLDVLRFLLEKGARVNEKTSDGHSALCFARNGEVKAVLRENGAELHAKELLVALRGNNDEGRPQLLILPFSLLLLSLMANRRHQ